MSEKEPKPLGWKPPFLEAVGAVAVVGGAALGVGQHLVRLGRLLELRLGLGVVAVDVRVQLAREAAEGLLDLVGVGVARDAETLVVIARGGHASMVCDR